jgi:hypothetical protein
MRATLLAIDPSLSGSGYAVFDLSRAEPHLIAAGVFETKKDPKAARTGDDLSRRVLFVKRSLQSVLREHRPRLVAAELPGAAQGFHAAVAMASAKTNVDCIVDDYLEGGSPIYLTPIAASTALGIHATQRTKRGEPKKDSAQKSRDRKARKAAIARAVVERLGMHAWLAAFGGDYAAADLDGPDVYALASDPRWEGAHDAAAIGLAAWTLPEVAAVRMMARQTTLAEVEAG